MDTGGRTGAICLNCLKPILPPESMLDIGWKCAQINTIRKIEKALI